MTNRIRSQESMPYAHATRTEVARARSSITSVKFKHTKSTAVKRGFLISTVGALLFAVLMSPSVSAQGTPDEVSWSVSTAEGEPNFQIEAAAGDTVTEEFVIANHSAVNLVLGVYASDAFTTEAGDTDLLQAGETPTGVGAWVRPSENTVTVNAGEETVVPFDIVIPADAAAGDHVGGIVTSLVLSEPDADGEQITIERRLGSRIYVRVAGQEAASVEFGALELSYEQSWNPFGSGTVIATYTLNNTGNMVIHGGGQATATPSMGGEATAQFDGIEELLPGNSITQTIEIPGVFPGFGTEVEVQFHPEIADRGNGTVATVEPILATASISLFPLPQLLAVLLLIAIVIVAIVVWRSRQREEDAAEPTALTPNPAQTAGTGQPATSAKQQQQQPQRQPQPSTPARSPHDPSSQPPGVPPAPPTVSSIPGETSTGGTPENAPSDASSSSRDSDAWTTRDQVPPVPPTSPFAHPESNAGGADEPTTEFIGLPTDSDQQTRNQANGNSSERDR